MKRKILIKISLLTFGISLLSCGFVTAAEQVPEKNKLMFFPMVDNYVPSLQTLTLKFIGKVRLKDDERVVEFLKYRFFPTCEKDVTHDMARLSFKEYKKHWSKRGLKLLDQYKLDYPVLGGLINQKKIDYSLSIQDLIDAGACIEIKDSSLFLNDLALTSLAGLQKIKNFSLLVWLDVQGNELKKLMPGVLKNLTALEWVDFSNNQLEELNPKVLENLPMLEWLDLKGNQLKQLIPEVLVSLPALKIVNLEDNKLSLESQEVLTELSRRSNIKIVYLHKQHLEQNQLQVIDQNRNALFSRFNHSLVVAVFVGVLAIGIVIIYQAI